MADARGPERGRVDAEWERELQRLRETYRLTLQRDLAALESELREALQSGLQAPLLEVARRLAHRLKGTAGTYGFEESCSALEQLEELLERLAEAATADAWAEIQQLLRRARRGTDPVPAPR